MVNSLDPLMRPKSVAVIGASDEPSRIGGRPVFSMLEGKYQGRLYPVNPSRETVQGLKAYPSIKDVPETVDSVVISVPASVALKVIQ
ncbi:MAG: CoA-binding protein, partial [Alphaproteobacteria bacterium]|nr:CoA-binding protein [Alphaproteobacteria bacterium]